MSNVIRVGMMPGRIQEVAVEEGTTIEQVLSVAELNAEGYDVKVDGTKVTNLSQQVSEETSLILLAKQVKGNADVTRIGMMPGRINEFALEPSTTFKEALEMAGLSAEGYDVKADGTKVTDLSQEIGETSLILLAKQVKGN